MNEQYIKIREDGYKFYYKDREMEIFHRVDGPAIEWPDGTKHWYLNGQLHREDGPAVEWANGLKYWYLHGKLHREDGPAAEYSDRSKEWYLNGKHHREDGPAIEEADGTKFWYLDGESITQENHKIITRLERQNLLFTIEEIAQYINGWVTGPFDSVNEIGKGTLLNALSQLECEQDGIVAFFNR